MIKRERIEDFIHRRYGYCYFEIEYGKRPIIFNLYVHPEYRRQGYARKLLQYVIDEIRQTGYIGEIDIEAVPREQSISKEKLESFYKNMGLAIISPERQNTENLLESMQRKLKRANSVFESCCRYLDFSNYIEIKWNIEDWLEEYKQNLPYKD